MLITKFCQAIHVDCFTAPSSSSHHHRRLVLCESTTHMWSFRLRPLPAYEQHQVRAQVDQLQLAEGKLLSAAAGSQVLTDLAMIELRRLLATISVQNDIMPQVSKKRVISGSMTHCLEPRQ